MTKTLLILSATAGTGHIRAGQALAETARSLKLPLKVHHEDILNYTSPFFKKIYGGSYLAIVNTSPELWGYLYKKAGGPVRPHRRAERGSKSPLLKLFDHFNYRLYLKTLRELNPDAVLCTHFLPYAAIAEEMLKSQWHIPFFSVPTDYDVHSLWINPSVRKYYVATEEAAWTVRSHGISPSRVKVTGIPVMPAFGLRRGKEWARRELSLERGTLTILILSGGYGVGFMRQIVPALADFLARELGRPAQMVVVCGNNRELLGHLKALTYPRRVNVRLFGFVENMDVFMESADILVTKSGGLTVSEAIVKRLPMLIFDPIPGQEARNADYLVEQGAALRASSAASFHFKLKRMASDAHLLRHMKSSASRISRPDAARRILRDTLKLIQ